MKIFCLFAGTLAVSLAAILPSCTQRSSAPQPTSPTPTVSVATATPTAKPPREERLIIVYEGEDGQSALALLKQKARIKIETSSLGELVVEINGVPSGNGHNFLYFVNGTMPKTGAANYTTKRGEQIEWKLVGPRLMASPR